MRVEQGFAGCRDATSWGEASLTVCKDATSVGPSLHASISSPWCIRTTSDKMPPSYPRTQTSGVLAALKSKTSNFHPQN
eukprot:3207014-Amphidinium_carterae.2